jgi:hypothetical protein
VSHQTTARFWVCFHDLPLEIQQLADKQHALLEQNPSHPSLHFKEVGKQLWSVRINDSYRALGLKVSLVLDWFAQRIRTID